MLFPWSASSQSPPDKPKLPDAAAVKFFETNIRPMLANRCFECHSAKKQRGDLRVDSLAALLEGGKSGPALKPGQPEQSLLIRAIRHDDAALQMPPKQKLPAKEIADLTHWVKLGAPWPDASLTAKQPITPDAEPAFTSEQKSFWAFVPPKKSALPPLNPPLRKGGTQGGWVQSPIDAFILAKLEEKGLAPAPPAEPRTLLRRMYFDLIGLPPTPAEVGEFVAAWDAASAQRQAIIARVIERLLASPHYGERWGRHWLDVARYADSNGMDENLVYANAWRYRDYVIGAFNQDKPYDQFVREQLAGDLLPLAPAGERGRGEGDAAQHLTATGFLVIGPKMLAEDDPVKMEVDIIDEQIDTIGRTFMGLTLGCGRCHDHKYDPFPTADYYALAGIFKSTQAMDNFKVVARWHERVAGTKEDEDRAKAHGDAIKRQQDLVNKTVDAANQELLVAERKKAAVYLHTAEELRKSQSIVLRSVMAGSKPLPAGARVLEAEDYTRGNVLKSYDGYGAGIGIIYNKGELPNVAEYEIELPAAGVYQLELRYAAAEARPVQIHLGGKLVKQDAAGAVTGTWNPDSQKWHVEGIFELPAGKNTLRLERAQPFPHIDKLALVPSGLPPGTAFKTLEQLAAERQLVPAFVKQWMNYLDQVGKPPMATELDKLVADPKGPFSLPKNLESHYPAATRTTLVKLRNDLAMLQKSAPQLPETMAVRDQQAVNLRVHLRGNHLTLGKEAPRRFPRILAADHQPTINEKSSGRLELANWLTRPEHPLTSRVMVNRIWHWHFGAGLVRSPDNFGRLGERPTHPELLDWLAVRFVESGWSIKALHREIMLSATYQQGTGVRSQGSVTDPENRLWGRWSRRRLEVEAIRDALLFVGGKLDPAMGGTVFEAKNRAYVPGYPNAMYDKYDMPRRSVYLPVIRSALYDVFQVFDFADPSTANGQRDNTTVAPQALFMMNSKLVDGVTRALAVKLLQDDKLDDAARLVRAYETVYARPPAPQETRRALDFLSRVERELTEEGAATERRLRAWQSLCRVLVAANEFVFVE